MIVEETAKIVVRVTTAGGDTFFLSRYNDGSSWIPKWRYSNRGSVENAVEFESVGEARRRLQCRCIRRVRENGGKVEVIKITTKTIQKTEVLHAPDSDAVTKLGLLSKEE